MKTVFLTISIIVLGVLFGCSSPTNNNKDKDIPRPSVTITADTVWAAKGTYHITCDLYVKAFLSIADSSVVIVDPGVTIYVCSDTGNAVLMLSKGTTFRFGKGASIMVGEGQNNHGTLIAHGTAADPILFTRDSAASSWGYEGTSNANNAAGIMLGYNATSQTSLTYCVIEYANVGIAVASRSVEISNCIIRNNIEEGIFFYSDSWDYYGTPKDSTAFINNVITNNGSYAITANPNSMINFSGTNDFSGNVRNGIKVVGGGVYYAIWKNYNVPYVVTGSIYMNNYTSGLYMIIRPGCRLEFTHGSYIGISGTFSAQGTPAEPIVFTAADSGGTTWGDSGSTVYHTGIKLYRGSASMRYCVVEHATSGIFVGRYDNGSVEISNCTFRNCSLDGITFGESGCPTDSASFLNNTVTANGRYPLNIYANHVGKLSGTGDFSGNGQNCILVHGDSVNVTAIWKKHNVPYVIDGNVYVGASSRVSLTIRPGCRMKYTSGSYLQVGFDNPGDLIAQGSPTDSIVFTKDTGASWWGYGLGSILIGTSATSATTLQYCDISCATTALYVETGVTIQRCQIHDNRYYGIYFTAVGLDGNVSNNTFSNNPLGDIYQ